MDAAWHNTSNLRLEVQEDPTGLVNLIRNPNGDLGAWGWITDTPSGVIKRISGASTGFQPKLEFDANTNEDGVARSEPIPISPDQYSAAFLDEYTVSAGASWTWAVVYLDVDGNELSELSASGNKLLTTGSNRIHPGIWNGLSRAPSNARFIQIRFNGPGTGAFQFRKVTVVVANTTTGLSTLGYLPPVAFVNVLGSVVDIGIERDELSVSTLSATFVSTALDPAINTLLRPGKRVQCMALNGSTWEPIFTGKIDGAPTVYLLTQRDATKRARITLAAVDAATDVANASRPEGVGTIGELPFVLEGAGVPWNVNGSVNQIATADVTVVSRNADAKAIDQVAITRDSRRGYAWVSRAGVLNVWDSATLPATLRQTFDEGDYGDDLDVSFDLESTINEVNVTLLRTNLATGETVEVPFGPYRDEKSARQWGIRSASFTVHGMAESAVPAYAAAVLAANANPQVRINSCTVAIEGAADASKRFIDLYDRHRLRNTVKGLDQYSRVTRISHTITPDLWTIGLGFRSTGSVAAPQTTPPVQSAPLAPTGVWQAVALQGPFTAVGGFAPRFMRDSSGSVHIQGRVNRNGAAEGSLAFVLPAGYRPTMQLQRLVNTEPRLTTSGGVAEILTNGDVGLFFKTGTPTLFYIDLNFTTL